MQRSKSHVVVGLCFVLAAIVVAGGIYAGLVLSRTTTQAQTPVPSRSSAMAAAEQLSAEPVAESQPEEAVTEATPQSTTERMTGTFGQGIGSNAQCEGRMWRFMDDGSFRLTDGESDVWTEGNWRVVNGVLFLTDMKQTSGDDETAAGVADLTYPVQWNGDLLVIGKHEYVPCAPNGRL